MESKIDKVKEGLAEKLDLPRDIVLNIPKIVITGDNEIVIENHKGIISFDSSEIKINSKVGTITLDGVNLEILFIGGNTITISGKFKSLIYEGL
ncbi:sporulation protein YqfC [Clostridium sp. YIM B02505]|uniref:Sporulation protein YqfC n=1 Tax=Clostridium yunnanense TaxID=2800325 RepID=A0ABS1ETZ9_9CLOT|nr:sporulation protein YqfC [Clostridium yunnanense]MBK1812866.1 sporulation protein YqfC [Clostridium yunnanense]